MTRKRYTQRQILGFWEAGEGKCWRCGKKITGKPTPVYGTDWELGHTGKAHWLGGEEVAPEHVSCNRADAIQQTKAAAKSIRIRAKAIGIRRPKRIMPGSKASPWKKTVNHGWVRR